MLIYRADLFEKYGIAVPETLDELTAAAVAVQEAVRADGTDDFYGITIRGEPNCGLNFWMVGSTWGPSYGARWYDDEGRPTLDTPELRGADRPLRRHAPAGGPARVGGDGLHGLRGLLRGRPRGDDDRAGERGIDHLRGRRRGRRRHEDGADAGRTARHASVGLYCPPYAIPSLSQSKREAWELAKFLCAPEQVLEDAQKSGFVEVSRNSVLNDPAFMSRFRPDLVETTVATRAFARGERPARMEVGDIIGDEIVRVLKGELTARRRCRTPSGGSLRSARPTSRASSGSRCDGRVRAHARTA